MKNSRRVDIRAVSLDRLIGVAWLLLLSLTSCSEGRRQELQLGLVRIETLISFKEGFHRRLPIDIGKLEKADEK